MRSIVDHVIDGIVTIDERGTVESYNKAAEKIFAYPPSEVIGNNVRMLMPDPFHSEHDGYLANYLRSGAAKVIGIGREVVGRRKDGSTFPMDLAVSEFHLGGRRFFTGIVRDITARKRAERDLREAAEELARSNLDLEQFAYVASHDLQEPLRAVAGYVQILERRYKGKLDAGADEFIGHAVDGAARMQALIDDLLAYSRVGTRGPVVRAVRPARPPWTRRWRTSRTAIEESGAVVTRDPLPDRGRRRGAAGPAVPEPARQRASSSAARSPPRIHVGGAARGRRLGCSRARQRHRHRAASTSTASSSSSSACTPATSTPAPASAWRSARRSSSATAGASGSSPSRARARPSPSLSRTEGRRHESRQTQADRDPARRGQPDGRAPDPRGARGPRLANNLHVATDGVEAMAFLREEGKHHVRARRRPHPARPEPAEEGRARGAARRSRPTRRSSASRSSS